MYEKEVPKQFYLGRNFSSLQAKHGAEFVKEAVRICEAISHTDLVSGVEIILELRKVLVNSTIELLEAEGRIK